VSPPIRETLTSRILHGKRRTVAIVVTKYDPVIVAEIVICQIPMQMFLFAMLINALHAAFEN
jgi:predicted aconitase with swiveling domain